MYSEYMHEFEGLCNLLQGHEDMRGVDLAGVVDEFVEGWHHTRLRLGFPAMGIADVEIQELERVNVDGALFLEIIIEYFNYYRRILDRALQEV